MRNVCAVRGGCVSEGLRGASWCAGVAYGRVRGVRRSRELLPSCRSAAPPPPPCGLTHHASARCARASSSATQPSRPPTRGADGRRWREGRLRDEVPTVTPRMPTKSCPCRNEALRWRRVCVSARRDAAAQRTAPRARQRPPPRATAPSPPPSSRGVALGACRQRALLDT